MSLVPRSRPWLALLSSSLLHGMVVALVLLAAPAWAPADSHTHTSGVRDTSGRRSGSVQLGGTARERPAGRDVLVEILSAADGHLVRLTSPAGDEAVGLAVLSPSRGLWLALDRVGSHQGRTLHAWQVHADGTRSRLTNVTIRDDASGRVIAWWDDTGAAAAPVTIEVTARQGPWPFARETRILAGTAPPRAPARRAREARD